MKPWLFALAIVLPHGLLAWAENVGSDDEQMIYVDDAGDFQYAQPSKPSTQATPPLKRKASGCRIPENNVESSPVKVYVDQSSQTISITVYNEDGTVKETHEGNVTTGGGLKIPNGENARDPYCAVTPTLNHRLIRKIREKDFGPDSGCTPQQIRKHSTVFDLYRSGTFTDAAGNPAPMAHAIRVDGGVFFHTAGREYFKLLGTENLSGGCIRLGPKMAEWLQAQIEKYGAIEVTISPQPLVLNTTDRRYCDQDMVNAAIRARNSNQLQQRYYTGTEGVFQGGRQGMQELLQSIGQLPGQFFDAITSPFRGR